MRIIIGLGNIGDQYKLTYHNIGFIILDAVCRHLRFGVLSKKHSCLISSGSVGGENVLLLKPCVFMNNSGVVVAGVVRFYKVPLDNVIVMHDDADLPLGHIKIKKGGGSAGHNGLKSIDDFIGNDYWRLRFGIGRPYNKMALSDYVLSKISQLDDVNILSEKIAANINLLINGEIQLFLRKVMYM